jgi:hypothetical protein
VTDRPRGSVSGKCAATTRLASGGDQSGHATRQQFSIAISRYVPLSFKGMIITVKDRTPNPIATLFIKELRALTRPLAKRK